MHDVVFDLDIITQQSREQNYVARGEVWCDRIVFSAIGTEKGGTESSFILSESSLATTFFQSACSRSSAFYLCLSIYT